MTDLAMPLSIFERALVSNILGRKIISMALEGTLETENGRVKKEKGSTVDARGTKSPESQSLKDAKQSDTNHSDLDTHAGRLVSKYVSELNAVRFASSHYSRPCSCSTLSSPVPSQNEHAK